MAPWKNTRDLSQITAPSERNDSAVGGDKPRPYLIIVGGDRPDPHRMNLGRDKPRPYRATKGDEARPYRIIVGGDKPRPYVSAKTRPPNGGRVRLLCYA